VPPKTAGIYTRLSRDRAGETSTERQEKDCRALCKLRGAQVVSLETDLLSGYRRDVKRPGYERFLAGIRAHTFDLAVIWKLDRLTRQGVREVARLLDALEVGGVQLVSVQDSIDTSTAMGEGILAMLASIAKQESENISTRVRSAKEYGASRGHVSGGGHRPFGYELDRITVNAVEAELVREAAARILAGETPYAVCADWHARGVVTPTGRPWQENHLRRMLSSPRLRGLRTHRGEVAAPAVWPAILDDVTGRRVAQAVALSGTRGRSPRVYLLTGLIVCGRCGEKLATQRTYPSQARTYVCVRRPGFASCGALRTRAEPVEDFVAALIIERVDGPAFRGARQSPADDAGAVAAAEVRAVEDRLVELAEIWAGGALGRAEWLAARRPLEDRLDAARRRLGREVGEPMAVELGPGLGDRWPRLELGRRRAIVEAVLERVTIHPTTHRGPGFDVERVEVTWRA
jgi:site-specific DNA recombinase